MITSQLILDTFDLIFDGHQSKDLLEKQVGYLSIEKVDHTGVGLFAYFIKDDNIYSFKVVEDNNSMTVDRKGIKETLVGIELKNTELNILADIIVHIKYGIIDCFEVFQKYNSNYPLAEPEHYEIYQEYLDKSRRRIIAR